MATVWLLTVFTIYHAVSARFAWLDTRLSSSPFDLNSNAKDNNANDFDSNFWAPFRLDISMPSLDTDSNSFFTSSSSSSSSPLYLQVQSIQRPTSNFMFILDESGKVNGNTYRYSIQNDGRNQIISRSWSTSNMYLCNTRTCDNGNRMEMMSVVDNLLDMDETKQKYLHLVPTTTAQFDAAPDVDTEEAYSWLDIAMNTMKGCHHRMKQMMMSNEQDDNQQELEFNDEQFRGQEVVVLNEEPSHSETHIDLFLLQTTAIILLVLTCGVLYAGWRFMMQRKVEKQKDTMDVYVQMQQHQVDAF